MTDGVLEFLARMLRAPKPGEYRSVNLFLGAGAPRGAGLPLADELKTSAAQRVFGDAIPSEISQGRLEDVMEAFQRFGGQSGYELVAQEIRQFSDQPTAYRLLPDLITHGFIRTLLTTNFDLLLERISGDHSIRLTTLSSDAEHQNTIVEPGSVLLAKLHGSADSPSTMRGSWTDGDQLPCERATVLRQALLDCPTVFIGWAGLDPDIRPVLREISESPTAPRIFWVDPRPEPSEDVAEILSWFSSKSNYLAITADEFFDQLHNQLFPVQVGNPSDLSPYKQVAERIRHSASTEQLTERVASQQAREKFRHRVNDLVRTGLAQLKASIAPDDDTWILAAKTLQTDGITSHEWNDLLQRLTRGQSDSTHAAIQIRTGAKALSAFVGTHEDGDVIQVTSLVAYHAKSKESTATPLPPLVVWGAGQFDVTWGSEASIREFEGWLSGDFRGLFVRCLTFFSEVVEGRAKGELFPEDSV